MAGGGLRYSLRGLLLVVAAVAGLFGVLHYIWAKQYPYGWSHCCDSGVAMALERYADEHGGAYPAGERTPEASLSLLYPQYIDAGWIRGKTVPEEVVQRVLDSGNLLGPDTCGWHYVEGLRSTDNPGLALFWDKVGLDHHGGVLPNGGHYVTYLHCNRQYVPAAEWDAFLATQKELWDKLRLKRAAGT